MKKLVALSLVVVMLMSVFAFAAADSDWPRYQSTLMSSLSATRSELMTSDMRPFTAAVILLDYFVNCPYDAATVITPLARTGNNYICAFGSNSIDVYYLRSDGQFFNLFYNISAGTITDYGLSSNYNTSSDYTYYSFSAADMFSDLDAIVSSVSN